MTNRLTSFLFACLLLLSVTGLHSQSAPSHLRYFGYALVDCLWDDPHDNTVLTNYVEEVDSFSNVGQLCIYQEVEDITSRVTFFNQHCIRPLITIQTIFYEITLDTSTATGVNLQLNPDFMFNWTTFVNLNSAVLDTSHLFGFYLPDEPVWNGTTFAELDTVVKVLKATFPDIPVVMVEAGPAVNDVQIPEGVDYIGFDEYGVLDPSSDPGFLAKVDTLKSRRSSPAQRLLLIPDAQFLQFYTLLGWTQSTMEVVMGNYYTLAENDTAIAGLICYLWPGGLDDSTQLGVRDMDPAYQEIHKLIGNAIVENGPACPAVSVKEKADWEGVRVYPVPAENELTIELNNLRPGEKVQCRIVNVTGAEVMRFPAEGGSAVRVFLENLPAGMYLLQVARGNGEFISFRITKE